MENNIHAQLVIDVIHLQHKIQKRLSSSLSTHGIGLTDYLVLNQLYGANNQTMRRSDLAEQVDLSPSGVTRLLNPLEKIGLISKEENPRDARVSLVALSETGKQVFEDAHTTFKHISTELLDKLNSAQLTSFSELLASSLK